MNGLFKKEGRLPDFFYFGEDVALVSRNLLGKYLFTYMDGILTGGKIVETEAYCGRGDRACHAYNGRRTARTETMYSQGGVAYVYLCYGIHSLLNVVTHREGMADAVLIRAIEPMVGIEKMLERRKMKRIAPRLTAGPGMLTQALGITLEVDGERFDSENLWIEDRKVRVLESEVVTGPRVGVGYAGEDAKRPWRFSIKDNPWVSKANPSYP